MIVSISTAETYEKSNKLFWFARKSQPEFSRKAKICA